MRVLIDHREVGYYFGGTENHIIELSKNLLKRGHQIIFVTEKGKEEPLNELKKFQNFKAVYLPSLKIRRSKKFKSASSTITGKIKENVRLRSLASIISNLGWIMKSSFWIASHRKKFDLVWVCKYSDSFALRTLNKIFRLPFVESLEGYDYTEAENAKKSKFVFSISEFITDKCKQVHKFEPYSITIGVDSKKFQDLSKKIIKQVRERETKGKKKEIVLNVARLVRSKDIPTYIHAASEVLKDFPDTLFIMCGDGEEKENLIKLTKNLHIEKSFFIKGHVSETDLLKYYMAADIFVHAPIFGNHFGIAYIEAMAAGLPIIASNKDASPKTVEGCALLITPGNSSEMAKAIKKLIQNKKLRENLSKNSLKRARQFDWSRITDQIESLFSKVISSY